jgi:catechol 2,3-dioxygenase-like lactoylglutathione lyase family enzyme
MTAPEIQCFHIAVIVDDLEKAVAGYKRFLGDGPWRLRDSPSGLRMAYGSAGGQTWELIQVGGAGGTQFHEFRERYGEGVQHIGFWTQDIKASVDDALSKGARLVSATADAQGHTSVQLLPAAEVKPDQIESLGMASWVDMGFGGWRLEYIASDPGDAFFKDWLGAEYPEIILNQPL